MSEQVFMAGCGVVLLGLVLVMFLRAMLNIFVEPDVLDNDEDDLA